MGITHEEAIEKLREWTEGTALLNHARAVEAVMRKAAHRYGRGAEDEASWAVAGLLHDADYERWPERHPALIVAWLRERGEEEIAHAVSCHGSHWGIAQESRMDQALLACDELTGFVMACCLVRPDRIASLTAASVKKKLKDRSFAAKVDREEIAKGVALLGTNLDDHIEMVIDALRPLADGLGIGAESK